MELMKKMIKSECGLEGGPFVQPPHAAAYGYHQMRGGYAPPVAVPPHFYPPEIDVGGKFYHPPPGQRFAPPNMACKLEKDDATFHGFMHPFGGDRQRLAQGLLKPVYEMEKMPPTHQETMTLPSPKVFSGPFDMGGGSGCSNGDPLHPNFKQVSSKSVSDSDKRDKQEDNNGKNFAKGAKVDGGSGAFVNSGSDIGGGAGAGGGDYCGSHHQPQLSGDESNGDDAFTTL